MATLGRLKHLENTFKILIMGDASVGKTSILTRYADSHFGKFCHMIISLYILISIFEKNIFRILKNRGEKTINASLKI